MSEFLILFLAFYVWHALGITIGYHRLLSHRSFSCPKPIEYFFVLGGYMAFEGSPIWWATIHRAHHRHVDTPLDPHSPRYDLRNAHYSWLWKTGYADHIDPKKHSKDLLKDPFYRFLEQDGSWMHAHWLTFGMCIGFRLLILYFFGWIPALASLLAGVALLQVPLMLNVVCHLPRFGYRNYPVNDDSVNVWWVALLAMGEGWHNNHHASPSSAKTGMKPWEIDVSWLVISGLRAVGLATKVNEHTHEALMSHALRQALPAASLQSPIDDVDKFRDSEPTKSSSSQAA